MGERNDSAHPGSWSRWIDTADRKRIRALQNRKVSRQAQWVYTNSSYWREKFDEADCLPSAISGVDDLSAAPFATKAEYRTAQSEHPPYGGLLCRSREELYENGAFVWETSGTTGDPVQFLCSQNEYFRVDVEATCRMLWTADLRPGDAVAMFWPLTLWAVGHGIVDAARELGMTVFPLGPSYSSEYRVEKLATYQPSTIMTTPSYALRLAEVASENGYDPHSLGVERVIVSGEPLPDGTRTAVAEAWGVSERIFDYYGLSEAFNCRSIECKEHDGMHVLEDLYLCQVVDPDGTEPLSEGETGELVVTALEQRDIASGFHYRTGDLARFTDDPCACGRTTRRIEIEARKDDMKTIRGVNVFPQAVESIVRKTDSVADEFSLVLEQEGSLDRLTVVLEPGPDLPEKRYESVKDQLERDFEKAFGGLTVTVEFVAPQTLERFDFKADRWVDKR